MRGVWVYKPKGVNQLFSDKVFLLSLVKPELIEKTFNCGTPSLTEIGKSFGESRAIQTNPGQSNLLKLTL